MVFHYFEKYKLELLRLFTKYNSKQVSNKNKNFQLYI